MARIKRSVASRKRRRRVLKAVRGHKGARSRQYKAAHEDLMHARQYAYAHRRTRRRDMRRGWILRINARARALGMTYSQFMHGLRRANIDLDRKVLADLALNEPEAFEDLVKAAQAAA